MPPLSKRLCIPPTPDYVDTARAAILKMYSQVGNLVLDLEGRAERGLIIRHLVLPNNIAGQHETLLWLRDNLPRDITLSSDGSVYATSQKL